MDFVDLALSELVLAATGSRREGDADDRRGS